MLSTPRAGMHKAPDSSTWPLPAGGLQFDFATEIMFN
jgi:hypothetical protein